MSTDDLVLLRVNSTYYLQYSFLNGLNTTLFNGWVMREGASGKYTRSALLSLHNLPVAKSVCEECPSSNEIIGCVLMVNSSSTDVLSKS